MSVQEFIISMMHSQTNAHLLHLQTRSYSEHKALQNYYEGIDGLIDSYVEAYQGRHGLVENYPNTYKLPSKPLEYMIELHQYVSACRVKLPQDSELQNIIDEIVQLIDSTLYRLRFLS